MKTMIPVVQRPARRRAARRRRRRPPRHERPAQRRDARRVLRRAAERAAGSLVLTVSTPTASWIAGRTTPSCCALPAQYPNVEVLDWDGLAAAVPGRLLLRRRHPPHTRPARTTTPQLIVGAARHPDARCRRVRRRATAAYARRHDIQHPCPCRRHRCRRPDRLQPAVPHRLRLDARPGHARSPCSCSRSRRRSARSRACGWSSTTAPSRCSPRSCAPTTPTSAFGDADVALLVGAMPRKAGMERSDLLSANGGIFKPQGEALSRSAKTRRQGARRRQPGQHQRPDRPCATPPDLDPGRFTAMTRLDHNRAISQIAQQARRAGHRRQEDDDLGQPLDDAVPRPVPRRGRRQERLRGRRRPRVGRRRRSSRPSPSAARRSSRPAAPRRRRRRPTPPSTTSARGCSARRTATGCRWRSPATAATACPRASSRASRCTCAGGDYEIVQGLDIDDYSRGKIDASAAELVEERDAVDELGLI